VRVGTGTMLHAAGSTSVRLMTRAATCSSGGVNASSTQHHGRDLHAEPRAPASAAFAPVERVGPSNQMAGPVVAHGHPLLPSRWCSGRRTNGAVYSDTVDFYHEAKLPLRGFKFQSIPGAAARRPRVPLYTLLPLAFAIRHFFLICGFVWGGVVVLCFVVWVVGCLGFGVVGFLLGWNGGGGSVAAVLVAGGSTARDARELGLFDRGRTFTRRVRV